MHALLANYDADRLRVHRIGRISLQISLINGDDKHKTRDRQGMRDEACE